MTWEALTAIGTIASAIVIAITVIFGARQVRLTGHQLDHLRRATQLQGMMELRKDIQSPVFLDALIFVRNDLRTKMRDPEYRRAVEGATSQEVHKELVVLREFETIGAWVRHGLLDDTVVLELYVPLIIASWLRLGDVVKIHRRTSGREIWHNFEALYESALRYGRANGPDIVRQLESNWERERAESDARGAG